MLNPFGVGVALGTDRDPGKGLPNYVLIFCARGIRLGADLHRVRYLAASRFLLACASAKWRSTALAAPALRLALKASRLARIQSIDCERHAQRSSKLGSTWRANNSYERFVASQSAQSS